MKDGQFAEIGKKIPYRVPDGFFDTITAQTLARIKTSKKQRRKKVILWATLSLAASFALLIMLQIPVSSENDVTETIGNMANLSGNTDGDGVSLPAMTTDTPAEKNNQLKDIATGEMKEDVPGESKPLAELLSSLSDEELLQLAARFKNDLLIETTNEY